MIAKFAAVLCFIGLARASGWIGSGLGYSSGYGAGLGYASGIGYGHGYSSYVAPAYTAPIVKTVVAAPIVTKAVIPAVSYAPAISTVSRYQVHSSPIVKSYVAPAVSYVAAAPLAVSYGHGYGGYSSLGYSGHGALSTGYGYGSGYGYGDSHGYGSKYVW
ncbi:hypothetical protein PYW08_003303 [Mythimna loreyi]|uniref:Uncharacterized protein n=1 Tax=Mythimna loreyi TaxID=667449 RepID=A0ACC2QRY1_9NEOP|nr:hypothetical protein PYW08_003303 [Mythimna loreyi]